MNKSNFKKEYNETINYVETTEPDKVAEYINDLQHQLAEKDKEIERLKTPCEYFINYNNHIVRKLPLGEEEIVLTPKEICDLLNGYAHEFMNYQERIIKIRHQVCEEIREKAFRDCIGLNKEGKNFYHYVISPEILDQIEQGE